MPLCLGQWDRCWHQNTSFLTSFQAMTELFLSALYLQMNILLGSSRGGRAEQPNGPRHSKLCLPGWFPHKTKWNSKIRHPFSTPTPQENTHILPSRNSRHHKKNEQLHTNTLHRMHLHGDTDTTIKNIKQDIDTIENTITQCGAVPVFCTATHMNITHYNNHLKQKGKTTRQHYTQHYNTMPTKVEKIIDQVNYYIIGKNIKHQVSTPYCNSAIKARKGRRTKHFYTNNWEGLNDGVHATPGTKQKWANSINTSIKYNRTYRKRTLPSDSEDNTTKSP